MRRWQLFTLAVAILLLTVILPVGLWLSSGSVGWLLLVPVLLLLLVAIILILGLWGSRGGPPALLAGQREPRPRHLVRDIGLKVEEAVPSVAVQVSVDLDRPVAEISERYLSFSIDTSQVVGGKWWNPEADRIEFSSGTLHSPVFDFSRPKLDRLVKALAPAYLRLGGSEADKTYYDLRATGRAPIVPPGYESAMSRAQWDAAHAFAARNDLALVFCLNAGPATRDRGGCWQGDNAAELLAYTAQRDYPVAVWELGNELNILWAVHGLQTQMSPRQYADDLRQARRLLEEHTPAARLAGQGSAFWPVLGEPLGPFFGFLPEILRQAGDVVDLVAWHYYPQQSRRGPMASRRAHPARLLDPRNLDEAAHWAGKLNHWRDQYAPGKPVWLAETGNAQFGGEPGLSDVYISGLWWLDQLGLLARLGHEVVVRQTLTGMDYGLLDEQTLEPRPDYWNSLLWRRLMGAQVYDATVDGGGSDRIRVYAHAAPEGNASAVTVWPSTSILSAKPPFPGPSLPATPLNSIAWRHRTFWARLFT